MTHHDLNIQEHWFDRIADRSKTAEVRRHDRDYQIGDTITFSADLLKPNPFGYRAIGKRLIDATISHVLPASVFPDGIKDGYSVLSLTDVGNVRTEMRKNAADQEDQS